MSRENQQRTNAEVMLGQVEHRITALGIAKDVVGGETPLLERNVQRLDLVRATLQAVIDGTTLPFRLEGDEFLSLPREESFTPNVIAVTHDELVQALSGDNPKSKEYEI